MAKLDIVIPSYQYGSYLRECLMSILTQELKELRLLVIDNASTDDSVEIAQEIAGRDRRVEVVARKSNLGATASWNEGIDWARSDYFMVICADDFLLPNRLVPVIEFLDAHPEVCFGIGRDRHFTQRGSSRDLAAAEGEIKWRVSTGRQFIQRQCRYPAVSSAAIVRTAMQKKAGYYRRELPFTDDLEMLLRLACLGHVAETCSSIAVQRLHAANLSNALWIDASRRFREGSTTFEKFFATEGASLPDAPRLQRLARRSFGKHAYWSALAHLCRGELETGKQLFRWAIARSPSSLIVPPVGYLLSMESLVERIRNALASALRGHGNERVP